MRSWWLRHFRVYLLYFGVLVLLRLVFGGIDSVIAFSTLWFLLGGLIGVGFSAFDRLVYVYYSRPDEQLSVQVRSLISQKRFGQAWHTLGIRREEQLRLAMNNVLFSAVWIALAIFMVTSSGSRFAVGLVMGVGLDLTYDLWVDWKRKDYLVQRLFWPVTRRVSQKELELVVIVFWIAFGILSLLVV